MLPQAWLSSHLSILYPLPFLWLDGCGTHTVECGWKLAISLPFLWLDGGGGVDVDWGVSVDKGSPSLSPSCGWMRVWVWM